MTDSIQEVRMGVLCVSHFCFVLLVVRDQLRPACLTDE